MTTEPAAPETAPESEMSPEEAAIVMGSRLIYVFKYIFSPEDSDPEKVAFAVGMFPVSSTVVYLAGSTVNLAFMSGDWVDKCAVLPTDQIHVLPEIYALRKAIELRAELIAEGTLAAEPHPKKAPNGAPAPPPMIPAGPRLHGKPGGSRIPGRPT